MLYAFATKTKKTKQKKKVERIINNVVLSSFVFLLIKLLWLIKLVLLFHLYDTMMVSLYLSSMKLSYLRHHIVTG